MRFLGRLDAGEQLSQNIEITDRENTVVLGLPRGGIPLGLVIAQKHQVAFDIVLAKKLVHSDYPEVAIGALAEDGEPLLNPQYTLENEWVRKEIARVKEENKKRRELYDDYLDHQSLEGKNVILVDDGIATGMTMFAAIHAVKSKNPKQITVAVPIIPKETYYALENDVDNICYVEVPSQFLGSVGAYYRQFSQVSDEEIIEMIR